MENFGFIRNFVHTKAVRRFVVVRAGVASEFGVGMEGNKSKPNVDRGFPSVVLLGQVWSNLVTLKMLQFASLPLALAAPFEFETEFLSST